MHHENVPPEMFMCKRHWFSLPKAMQRAIWNTYRPGQCDDWNISHEYAVRRREPLFGSSRPKMGRDADTSVYDMLDPKEPAK